MVILIPMFPGYNSIVLYSCYCQKSIEYHYCELIQYSEFLTFHVWRDTLRAPETNNK